MRIVGYFMLGALRLAEVFAPGAGWVGGKLNDLGDWLDRAQLRLDEARLGSTSWPSSTIDP